MAHWRCSPADGSRVSAGIGKDGGKAVLGIRHERLV